MELESFASNYSGEIQELLYRTHQLVENCLPGQSLRTVYGVPFYYLNKRICYLGVDGLNVLVGFCRGAELDDPGKWLSASDRKVIRHFVFDNWESETVDKLKFFLLQAYDLDRSAS